MTIIELAALENGAHRNQTGDFAAIPDGWAVVPAAVALPDTFPFVGVEAADADGVRAYFKKKMPKAYVPA